MHTSTVCRAFVFQKLNQAAAFAEGQADWPCWWNHNEALLMPKSFSHFQGEIPGLLFTSFWATNRHSFPDTSVTTHLAPQAVRNIDSQGHLSLFHKVSQLIRENKLMLTVVYFALEACCLLCSFEEEILMLQPPSEKHEVNTEIPKQLLAPQTLTISGSNGSNAPRWPKKRFNWSNSRSEPVYR